MLVEVVVAVVALTDVVVVVVTGWSKSQSAITKPVPVCHGKVIFGVPMHLSFLRLVSALAHWTYKRERGRSSKKAF